MKKILFLTILLSSLFTFSQNNNNFIQPFPEFSECKVSINKKDCFDEIIVSNMIKSVEDDLQLYLKSFPNCGWVTLYISFIIGEDGKAIGNSIRVSNLKNTNTKSSLKKAILNLPKINPVRNEFNHKLLFLYKLYIDVSLNENEEIIVLNKSSDLEKSLDNSIYKTPIYPSCLGKTNEDLNKCLSDNITEIIKKKFRVNRAIKSFNKKGSFNIYILFYINKNGEVDNISSFGPSVNFSNEASKAIKKIKKMQPGTKHKEPVNIPYSLPIVLKIE